MPSQVVSNELELANIDRRTFRDVLRQEYNWLADGESNTEFIEDIRVAASDVAQDYVRCEHLIAYLFHERSSQVLVIATFYVQSMPVVQIFLKVEKKIV